MGGKSSAPPPPDYTPIMNAQIQNSEVAQKLGEDQLNWAREEYRQNKVVSDKVINTALARQATTDQNAANDRARYQGIYQPLEDQLVGDAKSFATPAREQFDMGRAQAQVAQNFDAQRKNAERNLESFGVDPSSTRFAALDRGMKIDQAAAEAGAGNQARGQTEAMGRAMRSEAINVGRGYPGQIAMSYGTALQSGNSAANTGLATTQTGAQTMGTMPQYMGIGASALSGAANTMNQGYSNQLAAWNANQSSSSGLGGLFGSVLGMFAAEGGPVPQQTQGGAIPADASPSRGAAIDDVPARLTPGEFVVPKDVLSWKGEEYFQNVIKKSREAKHSAPAKPQFALAPDERATFASRPTSALPTG